MSLGLRRGQWVRADAWPGPLSIVAVNDALDAAAVRIAEGLEEGKAILVLRLSDLRPIAPGTPGADGGGCR
jgi:hypothetical protein